MTSRLRLLLATPFPPDPEADHGGGVYLGTLSRALAEACDLTILSLVRPSEREAAQARVSAIAPFHGVLHRFKADRGPAGRLAGRLPLLWRTAARGLPLAAAKFASGSFARALRRRLRALQPDAVLLEMGVFAQYLPACAGTPVVFTDHEAGGEGPLWRRYVRRRYPKASLLQAVTEEDACTLRARLGRGVAVRPVVVPLPPEPLDPASAPPVMGYLGNYIHPPNLAAAPFLAGTVLPLVRRELPEAALLLAGGGDNGTVAALARLEGVRYAGRVESAAGFLGTIRCLLAPALAGGGGRVKVLTALAHGLPVVTNALGARGLRGVPAEALAVAEEPQALARAAARLLRDPALAAAAGAAARRWCAAHLDPGAVAAAQLARVRELLA